ncbi:MAG: alpha/beta fold hydrolase [Vibrio sp.]
MKKQLNLASCQCSYTIYGNQERLGKNSTPLILLHGTNSDGEGSYGNIHPYFSNDRIVIIPDYAGCGDSSLPENELSVELLVDQILAIFADSGYEKFDVVGHSLGAVVAAVLASKHPHYINKLVLSAPWCNSNDTRHQLLFNTWKELEKSNPKLSMSFGLSHVLSPSFLAKMDNHVVETICNSKNDAETSRRIQLGMEVDIISELKGITSETLVIGLTFDTLIPTYMVQDVAKLINNSQYKEISSGHAVQIENPSDWVEEIHQFISNK